MSTIKINDVIFIDNLPTIDLHGFDKETARVCVNDFVRDNLLMKNELIVVIHGHGEFILKKAVHETLRLNRNVKDYKIHYFNSGCTVILLDLTK